jgi:pimeloyl-ACP methyl ester carboxylesterase
MPTIDRNRITANGLEFTYLEAGPSDGPLALCLHGFPDAAPTWNPLLAALGDAGFHAVAPWLRGYAPTAVPADGVYETGALERDAIALHEALGGDGRAVIIGHDWGAIATYGIACAAPDRFRRVVTMAVPPSGALGMGFLSYKQLQRSWYMFFFQSPLAEVAVAMNDLAFIDGLWADWSPGFDGAEHIAAVKDALRDPANLAAAIGYYRATLGGGANTLTPGTPTQPVLYLHGRNDGCLGVDLTTNAAMFLSPESRVEVLEDCGHFLQVERPELVNQLVVDWVKS